MDNDSAIEIQAAFENLKEAALSPFHILTSKPARRTYLNTALFLATSILLLVTAALAYGAFYYTYIPTLGFTRTVHLQFATGASPFGFVDLVPDITSLQPYDISVKLKLPRTPSNLAVGNFMLDVSLLGYDDAVLAQSSRPASLTYRSAAVEVSNKAARLPAYVLGWRQEAETVETTLLEEIGFGKGWVPSKLKLELQSTGRLQVYSAEVRFSTRFNGVRWLMYNKRTFSFVLFTSTFWIVEMVFAFSAYLVFMLAFGLPKDTSAPIIKPELSSQDTKADESEGLSDTSRTFPTFSKQPPLKYSSTKIREEEEIEEDKLALPTAAEADDEDEEDDFVVDHGIGAGMRSDSGLGTSMDSGAGQADALRRRKMKR